MEYSIKFHTEIDPILLFNPGRDCLDGYKKTALLVVQRENCLR